MNLDSFCELGWSCRYSIVNALVGSQGNCLKKPNDNHTSIYYNPQMNKSLDITVLTSIHIDVTQDIKEVNVQFSYV